MPLSKDGRGWWLFYTSALPMTEHTARLDGVDLYYRSGGSGPPLILLHGRTRSGLFWAPFLDALGEHYTVIVPDLPGHGRSSPFPGDFSHRRVARLMFALADELGLDRVRGIGHSSGAFVLIHMGVQQPQRVAAMVLVGGTHRSSLKHRAWVRSVGWEGRDEDTYELWRRQHPGGEAQIREMLDQFRKQADDHPDFDLSPEHLAVAQARTLIVLGDRDSQQAVECGVEMYRAIPQAALWIVPGEGHDAGMNRDPEAFARTALRFLGEGWPA